MGNIGHDYDHELVVNCCTQQVVALPFIFCRLIVPITPQISIDFPFKPTAILTNIDRKKHKTTGSCLTCPFQSEKNTIQTLIHAELCGIINSGNDHIISPLNLSIQKVDEAT